MKVLCNEAIIPIALDEELIESIFERKNYANYKTPIHYFKTSLHGGVWMQ